MEETKDKVDSRYLLKAGSLTVLLIVLFSFILSFPGFIFLSSLSIITFYLSSSVSRSRQSLGNYARSYVAPKTQWCTRIESNHILVPADVDEALEKLFERLITEHVDTWYKHLSRDEEFLQELRHIFRDLTNDILKRLSRVG